MVKLIGPDCLASSVAYPDRAHTWAPALLTRIRHFCMPCQTDLVSMSHGRHTQSLVCRLDDHCCQGNSAGVAQAQAALDMHHGWQRATVKLVLCISLHHGLMSVPALARPCAGIAWQAQAATSGGGGGAGGGGAAPQGSQARCWSGSLAGAEACQVHQPRQGPAWPVQASQRTAIANVQQLL